MALCIQLHILNQATDTPATASVPEAFGQQGVLQYLWPTLARASLLLAAIMCVFWARSHQSNDVFFRSNGEQLIRCASVIGRVVFFIQADDRPPMGWQWSLARVPPFDPWEESIAKFVGVQLTLGPAELPAGSTRLRVRYRTIIIVLMIIPAIYSWQRYRIRHRPFRR